MAPVIDIHARRQQRRLATAVRQAALHGTDAEVVQLRALVCAVGQGHADVEHARSAVASLRREQQARVAA